LTSGWSDSGAQRAALLAGSIISAGVAIIVAISQMEKYFETWILYRTTAEALKREKFLFQNSCAQYSKLCEPDKNRLLVERVEAMTSSENSKFFAFQQQTREMQQQQGSTQQKQSTIPEQQK
jgi:vacuolar-type H+-ATPase catalytic subunit A/Vma1